MEERRRFTRVLFSNQATLMTASGDYTCKVLDLSLNGALITLPVGYIPLKNEPASLKFNLPDSEIAISMEVEIGHIEEAHLGLHCCQIDIESVTHLKRLIELNVGNDDILHRELEQLIWEK
ncbi:PilZ domain-containing protein [Pseudoalteromonas citrea]|uniref:Cyclic diguanosine monophosphate-binding protein n=3 Tax=Pseudoalteromonas citrea TaxID=43655 RepID=A0A5S3XV74_9GAMM|nr:MULTISPECIES: PilZ domain-containing protein [Pseudoalteromonas]RJE78176.1 pilus assembly protein [Pseudoalteromonas sp. MSK9-3]TMP46371.1 PilZ domain-containing protein [Pseudoalteromonas citrea]TMP62306.1 PilZ domain-containing protein [Pseudoalteromonas citrea]